MRIQQNVVMVIMAAGISMRHLFLKVLVRTRIRYTRVIETNKSYTAFFFDNFYFKVIFSILCREFYGLWDVFVFFGSKIQILKSFQKTHSHNSPDLKVSCFPRFRRDSDKHYYYACNPGTLS